MKKPILSNDLSTLQNEKSAICISIIMPTHRLSPGRRTDPAQLEKMMQQVISGLRGRCDDSATTPLIQAMGELYDQIDFTHNTSGIGMFVSQNVKGIIHFSFPVKERVLIDQSFDIRDLLYELFYAVPYVILMLSQKEARLFMAHLDNPEEITDMHFPKKYENAYEYSRPARGSSYVGHSNLKEFEKDKSVTEEIRIKSFFRETDELLNSYLNIHTPLIITGDNKDLSYFRQVTTHEHNIACNIPGNYNTFHQDELGALTWKAMKLSLDNRKEKLVRQCIEKMGQDHAVTGINNVWKAVQEGRCYKLLVEKDYSRIAYQTGDDDYNIYLQPPREPHTVLPDVVNTIIGNVLQKNGEVIVVENDVLRNFQRLALITRY